jgi:hypothetical protein
MMTQRLCVLLVFAALAACTPASVQQGQERTSQPAPDRGTPDAKGKEPAEERSASRATTTSPDGAGRASGEASASAESGPLAALAWLEGCWQGSVNQREFREQWLPLRGGLMIGAGQSVLRGRMQDYEFLRIEPRADGVYFTQFSGDLKQSSFRLAATTTDEKDTIFTFANTADAFPARLIYRRGIEGWLYQTIEGSVSGSDRRVIYPLRRVDCETGEFIHR